MDRILTAGVMPMSNKQFKAWGILDDTGLVREIYVHLHDAERVLSIINQQPHFVFKIKEIEWRIKDDQA